jgi:hypothetical protein
MHHDSIRVSCCAPISQDERDDQRSVTARNEAAHNCTVSCSWWASHHLDGRYRTPTGKGMFNNISAHQILYGSLLPNPRSFPLTLYLVCQDGQLP